MKDVELHQLLRGNHRALLLVIDALPFPIYYKDHKGRYLGCNKAYEEFVEIPKAEIIGQTVFQVFDKIPASIFAASDQELLDNPGIQIYESPVIQPGQDTRYVKFHKATFHDEDGSVAGLDWRDYRISPSRKSWRRSLSTWRPTMISPVSITAAKAVNS